MPRDGDQRRGSPARILQLPSDISLAEAERAHERMLPHLRYTPLLQTYLACADRTRLRVSLKLENLQVTESFAVRGVLNAALMLPPDELATGLVGYGLMHGPAVAYTCHVLHVPSHVYLYRGTDTPEVLRQLHYWGATVDAGAKTLADAEAAARAHARRLGTRYVHSSASRHFILGCATIALEMLDFAPDLDVLVTGVGFGPLIAGLASVAKQVRPSIRVVGVDRGEQRNGYPFATDIAHHWRRHRVGSILDRADRASLELVDRYADDIVLASQTDATRAAHLLWSELEVRTGSFGSSAVAALLSGQVPVAPGEAVGVVVTNAGGDGLF